MIKTNLKKFSFSSYLSLCAGPYFWKQSCFKTSSNQCLQTFWELRKVISQMGKWCANILYLLSTSRWEPQTSKGFLHHSTTRYKRATPWRLYGWVLEGKSHVGYKIASPYNHFLSTSHQIWFWLNILF